MSAEHDKPLREMSRAELEHLVEGCEFLLERMREMGDELLRDWDSIPETSRFARVRRAFAPTLINPRPLDDAALAGLRAAAAGSAGNTDSGEQA